MRAPVLCNPKIILYTFYHNYRMSCSRSHYHFDIMARSKKTRAAAKPADQPDVSALHDRADLDFEDAVDSLEQTVNLGSSGDQDDDVTSTKDHDAADDLMHSQLDDVNMDKSLLENGIESSQPVESDLTLIVGTDESRSEANEPPKNGGLVPVDDSNSKSLLDDAPVEKLLEEPQASPALDSSQKVGQNDVTPEESENDILDSYDSDDASIELVTAEFESVSSRTVQKVSTGPKSVDVSSLGTESPREAFLGPAPPGNGISVPESVLSSNLSTTNDDAGCFESENIDLKLNIPNGTSNSPTMEAQRPGSMTASISPSCDSEAEDEKLSVIKSRPSTDNVESITPQAPEVLLDRTPIDEAMRLAKLDQPIGLPKSNNGISRSNSLLQSRFDRLNDKFLLKDENARTSILKGTENIKRTFNDIKDTVGGLSDSFSYGIDWDFWTQIVNDYELVLKNDPKALYAAVLLGIPKEVRGIVWQLVARSKNFELEELYMQLKTEPSAHEKSIKRDLTRTSFFTNVEQVKKSDELYNVIKAYSLFDPDVGYTQGMIFIAVPLIMNISEAECFSLLVTLMKDYGLRELFCPDMRGLHLMLYQFDRLLETRSPLLYNHLVRQGIKSSMYASQWFLTFFAYKFPLNTVLRIYDILVTQGIEAILKFAVNLMMENEDRIMKLKFDALLAFLKNDLFDVYATSSTRKESSDRGSTLASTRRIGAILGGKPANPSLGASTEKYDLDKYVADSLKLELIPNELMQYEQEFDRIYQDEVDKAQLIEETRIENGKLRQQIKNFEIKYLGLNYEHLDAVQQMVHVQFSLPELYEQHGELANSIRALKTDIEELKSRGSGASESPQTNPPGTASIPLSIDQNIQNLLQVNAEQAELCANLEDELALLTLEEASLDEEISARSTKWFKW